jgi:hypothetical protein
MTDAGQAEHELVFFVFLDVSGDRDEEVFIPGRQRGIREEDTILLACI